MPIGRIVARLAKSNVSPPERAIGTFGIPLSRSRDSLLTTNETSSMNRRMFIFASLRTRIMRFSMSSL
jgi:hypothetical protein